MNKLEMIKMKETEPIDLGEEYIYELKYDGTQAQIEWKNGKIKLTSKRGKDITEKYRHIAEPMQEAFIRRKTKDLTAIGEICYFPDHRRTAKTQFPIKKENEQDTKIVIFEIIQKGKYHKRRQKIIDTFKNIRNTYISYSFIDFETAWNRVKTQDLEGVIAKHKDQEYRYDNGTKMKNHQDKDIPIKRIEETEGKGKLLIGVDGTRCMIYDTEQIKEIQEALTQYKHILMTVQTLTNTKRFPKFKKYEIKA